MTRLELPGQGLDRWRQQVSHGVVELGQVHPNPCPQEDNVAHQGLILKGGSEGAVLTLLDSWPQRLDSSSHVKHKLNSRRSGTNVGFCCPVSRRGLEVTTNRTYKPKELQGKKEKGQGGGEGGGGVWGGRSKDSCASKSFRRCQVEKLKARAGAPNLLEVLSADEEEAQG